MNGKRGLLLVTVIVVLCGSLWAVKPWESGAADLQQVRKERLSHIRASLTQNDLQLGQPILIRIFKETDELEVWVKSGTKYRLYKTFRICSWSGALGPKQKEGDGQSPEGFYSVSRAQMKPDSQYHLAFNLGYPNAFDRANRRTGSYLMVHGKCASIGCYAMTDKGIEEIWLIADEALKGGQTAFQVHVYPFRMTDPNIQRHAGSPWLDFWMDIKAGYDRFEQNHSDLNVTIVNKRYRVAP
ncbi:murein L,D-transpeptidase family protein [Asticcacaulis sp.]|uniref:murein L,D-transpeptidase family protein n=1 Tax=Asticcacaulis sp. TaxID=1872648 RepID=UPI0031D17FB4